MKLNDYEIPTQGFNCVCNMPISTKDLSGETSSTETAFTGIKAKILSVKFLIPTDKPEALSKLIQTAEATENGDLVVYDIVDDLADALNINQVSFYESVKIRELEDLNAYRVNFKLKEFISTPEKTESREAPAAPITNSTGASSAPGQTQNSDITPKTLSTFEKILDYLDEKIEALETSEDQAQ